MSNIKFIVKKVVFNTDKQPKDQKFIIRDTKQLQEKSDKNLMLNDCAGKSSIFSSSSSTTDSNKTSLNESRKMTEDLYPSQNEFCGRKRLLFNIDNKEKDSKNENEENLKVKEPIFRKFTNESYINKEDNTNGGRWSEEEHSKFVEAIVLFENEWKKVQNFVGTRSATQSRSHGQKFFLKLKTYKNEKEGIDFTDPNVKSLNDMIKQLKTDDIKEKIDSINKIANEVIRNSKKKADKINITHQNILLQFNQNRSLFQNKENSNIPEASRKGDFEINYLPQIQEIDKNNFDNDGNFNTQNNIGSYIEEKQEDGICENKEMFNYENSHLNEHLTKYDKSNNEKWKDTEFFANPFYKEDFFNENEIQREITYSQEDNQFNFNDWEKNNYTIFQKL